MAKNDPIDNNNDEKGGNLYVHYKGSKYDIGRFADNHPGGADILQALEGCAVDDYMSGKLDYDGYKHKHSKHAYSILAKYACASGHMNNDVDQAGIDFSKPIVAQVGSLGDKYWSWIHDPVDVRMRLFESNFLEMFSRNKWFTITMVWMPVVIYFCCQGLNLLKATMPDPQAYVLTACLFLSGMLAWTLLEYVLHRHVFHWRPNPKSRRQLLLHFIMHGIHHKAPMDPDRLVFPPALAALVVVTCYVFYKTLFPWPYAAVFASGKLFGYICYDCTHYYLHHGRPRVNTYYHMRKQYHHAHHYKQPDLGFGISTLIWDYVFSTVGGAHEHSH